jgi:hypothetical protein
MEAPMADMDWIEKRRQLLERQGHPAGDAAEPDSRPHGNGHTNGNAKALLSALTADPEIPYVPAPKWPKEAGADAFYGLAGEIVATIEPHTEADRIAILTQLLVAFGNACGRHAYFVHEQHYHYTNLYCVVVGKTARARKGTSWRWVRAVLTDEDPSNWADRIRSGLSSGEGLINAFQDDECHGDKRLLVVEEEFANVLRVAQRDGNTLSGVLRQAWDRDRLSTMTRNNALHAEGAHLSVIGHITKYELGTAMRDTDRANGLANRILWVASKRSQFLPNGGGRVDLAYLRRRMAQALTRAMLAAQILRTAEADQLWEKTYRQLTADRPGVLDQITCRAEAQVTRLSLIYALLDGDDRIDVRHLLAAQALWQYCEDSACYAFGGEMADPDTAIILKALRDAEYGMTMTQIHKLFHNKKPSRDINQCLQTLEEAGLVDPGKKPGPKAPAQPWRARK